MSENPDFEALRKRRNEAFEEMAQSICDHHGFDRSAVFCSFNPDACYCACPDGPCEHDFQEWREFEDGNGGEQFCSRCGLGAMAHTLRVGP